ncbi:LPXTG cell wall anchor domain-containing protein, partial [Enterococcus gilvus]|uniref:LPXTG cell wall anchor domain-containing protein n=1 Tax=Enterococcus gilvus TaxID=160453 RepID=UPI003D6AAD7B
MKKKIDLTGRKKYLFFVLLIVIVLNLFASTKVKAEEKLSRLSFDHISITNITKEQKDNLIKDKPSGIAKMDNERFILVYQPQKEGSYNSNSNIETNTPLGINSSFSKDVHGTLGVGSSSTHAKMYPQTNSKKNTVLSVVGLGIVLFVIVLIKKQYRKSKIFMLFIGVGLISSMFGNGIKGHAEVNDFLIPTVNQTVSKGTNINYDVPKIKGYEYVGYLKTDESITPPTPETGKVIVS